MLNCHVFSSAALDRRGKKMALTVESTISVAGLTLPILPILRLTRNHALPMLRVHCNVMVRKNAAIGTFFRETSVIMSQTKENASILRRLAVGVALPFPPVLAVCFLGTGLSPFVQTLCWRLRLHTDDLREEGSR